MYQVKVQKDEATERLFYVSYGKNGDIMCDDLPPYQDIEKAQSCYLEDGSWVFDEGVYLERCELKIEQDSALSNVELGFALMDVSEQLETLTSKVYQLETKIDLSEKIEELKAVFTGSKA